MLGKPTKQPAGVAGTNQAEEAGAAQQGEPGEQLGDDAMVTHTHTCVLGAAYAMTWEATGDGAAAAAGADDDDVVSLGVKSSGVVNCRMALASECQCRLWEEPTSVPASGSTTLTLKPSSSAADSAEPAWGIASHERDDARGLP